MRTFIKKCIKKIIKKDLIPFKQNKELLALFSHKKRAFIFGSAESINNLNLTNFDNNDLLLSVGNFFEHPDINLIKPDIHFFAATHPPITKKVLTNWWERCNKQLPRETLIMVEKRDKEVALSIFKGRNLYFYSYGGSFPIDFTKNIISPSTITIVALQLAIYCEIKKIVLLGIHHDWQYLKPYKHFYKHTEPSLEYYLSKENISHFHENRKNPLPKEILYRTYKNYQLYETIKKYANEKSICIYNGDFLSNFDVFEKIEINELKNTQC